MELSSISLDQSAGVTVQRAKDLIGSQRRHGDAFSRGTNIKLFAVVAAVFCTGMVATSCAWYKFKMGADIFALGAGVSAIPSVLSFLVAVDVIHRLAKRGLEGYRGEASLSSDQVSRVSNALSRDRVAQLARELNVEQAIRLKSEYPRRFAAEVAPHLVGSARMVFATLEGDNLQQITGQPFVQAYATRYPGFALLLQNQGVNIEELVWGEPPVPAEQIVSYEGISLTKMQLAQISPFWKQQFSGSFRDGDQLTFQEVWGSAVTEAMFRSLLEMIRDRQVPTYEELFPLLPAIQEYEVRPLLRHFTRLVLSHPAPLSDVEALALAEEYGLAELREVLHARLHGLKANRANVERLLASPDLQQFTENFVRDGLSRLAPFSPEFSDLLEVARDKGMTNVAGHGDQLLMQHPVSSGNIATIWTYATQNNIDGLKARCIQYARDNDDALNSWNSFERLPLDLLRANMTRLSYPYNEFDRLAQSDWGCPAAQFYLAHKPALDHPFRPWLFWTTEQRTAAAQQIPPLSRVILNQQLPPLSELLPHLDAIKQYNVEPLLVHILREGIKLPVSEALAIDLPQLREHVERDVRAKGAVANTIKERLEFLGGARLLRLDLTGEDQITAQSLDRETIRLAWEYATKWDHAGIHAACVAYAGQPTADLSAWTLANLPQPLATAHSANWSDM